MSQKDFRLSTDYPLDKIVFFGKRDNLGQAGSGHSAIIPHGLSFIPLVFGVWATKPDFIDSRNFGQLFDSIYGFVMCYADAINIYVDSYATNASGSPVDVWVRVYAFEPAGTNGDAPFTNTSAVPLIFSTDFKYTKLYKAETIETSTGTSQVIAHDLGYRPQVMAWKEQLADGVARVSPYSGGFGLDDTAGRVGIEVDSSAVTVRYFPSPSDRIHVRVYLDAQA